MAALFVAGERKVLLEKAEVKEKIPEKNFQFFLFHPVFHLRFNFALQFHPLFYVNTPVFLIWVPNVFHAFTDTALRRA